MNEETPRRRGRPPTGRTFPHKVNTYLTDEELRALNILADERNGSGRPLGQAGVIRKAIRELAQRRGIRLGEESSE